MQYKTILFEVKDKVTRIQLNRPEAMNSINLDMAKELLQAVLYCSEEPTIRAVLITGTGDVFCAGGDVKAFASKGKNLPNYTREVITYLHAAVSGLVRINAPVIVAVNGTTAGAGIGLVGAGDIVMAAESARFVIAYTKIGLTPDAGTSYFLPRLVGLRRALELTLTNRELSAREALDIGLVNHVVPDAELPSAAEALTSKLAAGATRAIGMSKRLLHYSWNETLETQMEQESQSIADIVRTLDAQEAIKAFVEKREPKFTGR